MKYFIKLYAKLFCIAFCCSLSLHCLASPPPDFRLQDADTLKHEYRIEITLLNVAYPVDKIVWYFIQYKVCPDEIIVLDSDASKQVVVINCRLSKTILYKVLQKIDHPGLSLTHLTQVVD